jgi:hypothetical protein
LLGGRNSSPNPSFRPPSNSVLIFSYSPYQSRIRPISGTKRQPIFAKNSHFLPLFRVSGTPKANFSFYY